MKGTSTGTKTSVMFSNIVGKNCGFFHIVVFKIYSIQTANVVMFLFNTKKFSFSFPSSVLVRFLDEAHCNFGYAGNVILWFYHNFFKWW